MQMKMVIITAVEEYKNQVISLLKVSGIDSFSGSSIEGYKNAPKVLMNSSWFPSDKAGASSLLFFSFTEKQNVDVLFERIKELNEELESNPIRAVEMPIERSI